MNYFKTLSEKGSKTQVDNMTCYINITRMISSVRRKYMLPSFNKNIVGLEILISCLALFKKSPQVIFVHETNQDPLAVTIAS